MERRAQLVSQVDDILRGIEALQIPAFDAFSPASGRLFVPKQALRSYLTPNKIETLHRSCRRPTSHSEKVRNYYLAVFAILFEIGKGKYILHFIPYDGFADEFLPFDEFTKKKWPHDCRKFFDKFYDTQWEFCAQQLKAGRLENKRMDPKRIIPIIAKVCLKGGPNANILKIKVHPDYNELVSKDDRGRPSTDLFVLKSHRTNNDELHFNEVYAYEMLRQEDIVKNIVHFYGS